MFRSWCMPFLAAAVGAVLVASCAAPAAPASTPPTPVPPTVAMASPAVTSPPAATSVPATAAPAVTSAPAATAPAATSAPATSAPAATATRAGSNTGPAAAASSNATGKLDIDALLPNAPGRELVLQYCVNCHNIAPIALAHKTPDEWEYHRKDHVGRVQISSAELDQIYNYLIKNFPENRQPPQLPPELLQDWTSY